MSMGAFPPLTSNTTIINPNAQQPGLDLATRRRHIAALRT